MYCRVGCREFRMSANSSEPAFYLDPVLFVMADHMTGAKPPVSDEATTLPTLRTIRAHHGYDDCSQSSGRVPEREAPQ